MRRMGIVLVGYRGSGKTTVGRRLADRLGLGFVDLDDRIVAAAGKTIRAIFAEKGESAFRDLESRALAEALAESAGQSVVSLGGGAIERAENRRVLRDSGRRVVYLRCEVEELLRRISADPQTTLSRPNLTALGGGREEIAALLARREPWYREVADGEIDVTGLALNDVVARLVEMM
jgi:shikimate kinase